MGYALVGAFLLGVLVGFGVSRIIDKEVGVNNEQKMG